MKIELITKSEALKKYKEVEAIAWSIAESNDTVPGFCESFECKQYVDYLSVTQLKEAEVCVFIDGLAARQITEMVTEHGTVVGKLCGCDISKAEIQDNELILFYADGVKEIYSFNESVDAWKYKSNNVSGMKLQSRSIN